MDTKEEQDEEFLFAKILKMTKYTSLPNLVRLGQWEQVSEYYYILHSTTGDTRGEDAPVCLRNNGREERGGSSAPPFWGQEIFFPLAFFGKLIVHKILCLKLFCSSKTADFRAIFAKFSAAHAFLNH